MPSRKARNRRNRRTYGERPATLDRKVGGRQVRPIILILTEGKKTEPRYFIAMCRDRRLSAVQVRVVGVGADPTQLVREAEKERAAILKDLGKETEVRVWVIFDCEATDAPVKLEEAIRAADRTNIEIAVSNPAFELWYLWHLTESSKPFQRATQIIKELQPLLKSKNIPPYTKTNRRMYEYLKAFQADAISRAARVNAYDPALPPRARCPNPSTGVYRLVDYLLRL